MVVTDCRRRGRRARPRCWCRRAARGVQAGRRPERVPRADRRLGWSRGGRRSCTPARDGPGTVTSRRPHRRTAPPAGRLAARLRRAGRRRCSRDVPATLPAGGASACSPTRLNGSRAHADLMAASSSPRRRGPPRAAAPRTPTRERVPSWRRRSGPAATSKALAGRVRPGARRPDRCSAQLEPELTSCPTTRRARTAFAVASQYARAGTVDDGPRGVPAHGRPLPGPPAGGRGVPLAGRLPRQQRGPPPRRARPVPDARPRVARSKPTGVNEHAATTRSKWRSGSNARAGDDGNDATGSASHSSNTGGAARVVPRRASTVEPQLAAFGPVYRRRPGAVPVLSPRRGSSATSTPSVDWYRRFLAQQRGEADDPWRDCRRRRAVADRPRGASRRSRSALPAHHERPFLDGKLDDACWQDVKPLALKTPAARPRAEYADRKPCVRLRRRVPVRRRELPAPGRMQRRPRSKRDARRRPAGRRPRQHPARPGPRLPDVLPPPGRPARLPRRGLLGRPDVEPAWFVAVTPSRRRAGRPRSPSR